MVRDVLHHVFGDDFTGQGGGLWPELSSRVYHCLDACLCAVADDGAQLPPARINDLSLDKAFYIGMVMPKICGNGACAEIYIAA